MQAKLSHLRLLPPASFVLPAEDIVAERALLGSLMAGDSKLEDVEQLVHEDMFAVNMHRVAWAAMVIQRDSGDTYGFVEVRSLLAASNFTTDQVGDIVDAFRDHVWTVGAKAARAYAESVRRAWCARRAREVCTELGAMADHRREGLEDAIDKAGEDLTAIRNEMALCGAETDLQSALLTWGAKLSKPPTATLPTGIRGLDEVTGGLARKQTTIIGARTSVGKSALALQMALAAAEADHGVLYVSMEMTPEVLVQRAISHLAQVDGTDLRRRSLDATQYGRINGAAKLIRGMALSLNASQSLSLAEILSLATDTHRSMRRRGKVLGLVVVDHIGIIRPRADSGKISREQQISEVSRSLRGIAERLDCHVIACCQVNRSSEKRQGAEKRPQLHDLRESGSIEQDADVVALIHRPRDAAGLFLPTPAEIVIAKNRVNGELGMVRASFDGGTQTFTEVRE